LPRLRCIDKTKHSNNLQPNGKMVYLPTPSKAKK
jgi:hypothetical protein